MRLRCDAAVGWRIGVVAGYSTGAMRSRLTHLTAGANHFGLNTFGPLGLAGPHVCHRFPPSFRRRTPSPARTPGAPHPPRRTRPLRQLLIEHHYLKSATLVGEHLRYVATHRGRWLALRAWAAPARHLRARDQWIGWSDEQRRRRLALLVSNTRFLILPECHLPNLASATAPLLLPLLPARREMG